MTVLYIALVVIALSFATWVALRLTAPKPTPDVLTGVAPPPDILWWLKTPPGVEKPIRKWEWLIAYTAFGVILAVHWVGERLFPRWYNGEYGRISPASEEMARRAGQPR